MIAIALLAFALLLTLSCVSTVERSHRLVAAPPAQGSDHLRRADRLRLVDALATAVLGLVFSWAWGPWTAVAPLWWALPVTITTFALLRAAAVWARLPWVSGSRPRAALAGTVVSVGVAASICLTVLVGATVTG